MAIKSSSRAANFIRGVGQLACGLCVLGAIGLFAVTVWPHAKVAHVPGFIEIRAQPAGFAMVLVDRDGNATDALHAIGSAPGCAFVELHIRGLSPGEFLVVTPVAVSRGAVSLHRGDSVLVIQPPEARGVDRWRLQLLGSETGPVSASALAELELTVTALPGPTTHVRVAASASLACRP